MSFIICKEIRKVEGGYIAVMRYPYAGTAGGFGEMIFTDIDKMLATIREAALPKEDHWEVSP